MTSGATRPAPSTAVLEAIAAGTPTLAAVARRTGLDESLVRILVDRLVDAGRLGREALSTGCSDGGCGACPTARSGGVACPVLLTLTMPER